MIRKVTKALLAGVLALTLVVAGCTAASIQSYINLAVNIALQIAVLAGAPQSSAAAVSADLVVAQQLIKDFHNANAAAQPGVAAHLDATLTTAQADLATILTLAHVGDPKILSIARASLAIAITAVESIRTLALQNAPAPVKVALGRGSAPKGSLQSPGQLKTLYNQTVSAYPSAQLK